MISKELWDNIDSIDKGLKEMRELLKEAKDDDIYLDIHDRITRWELVKSDRLIQIAIITQLEQMNRKLDSLLEDRRVDPYGLVEVR